MKWVRTAAVVALVACGLYGVADALSVWAALGVGVLVLLAVWRWSWRRMTVVVLRVIGAALVAFLAMAGVALIVNLLIDLLHHVGPLEDLKLPIAVGLLIAMVAFGSAAYWYLRRADWETKWSVSVAVGLAIVVVLVAPYAVGRLNADTAEVEGKELVHSKLDVLIVTDGSSHRVGLTPPASPALREFDVTYSIGYAAGDRVRWTLLDGTDPAAALDAIAAGGQRPSRAGQPTARSKADHVLLLYVDGTPSVVVGDPAQLPDVPAQNGEVERWRKVARSVALQAEGPLPTFALLQTTAKRRLAQWQDFASSTGPISVQALGSQTAADAAVRLAIAAPTAQQDLALAMQHRPILLFDRSDMAPRPLSIEALFNEEKIRLCDEGLGGATCGEPISHPRLLESGGTHLRLELPEAEALKQLALDEADAAMEGAVEPAAGTGAAAVATLPEGLLPSGTVARAEDERVGSQSAIYVHPVPVSREGKELLYLDYWWYLPYNPVKLGGGALCGAGLVISGVTCHTHESDWEGVTMVVDRSGKVPHPVAVHYAQHSSVVRYSWSLLREKWDNREMEERIKGVSDASLRPLVFVAADTHAGYPLPCNDDCDQFAAEDLPEQPHRGNVPWGGNDTNACGKSSCLQMLPTHDRGRQPALWNGYDGSWGEANCFLTYYCDSGPPPKSPGSQRRYKHPTWYDGYAGTDWDFHDVPSAE